MADFYTIQEVLSFAIRLEQASQEFYWNLSQKTHSVSVSRFLAELVKEEKLHEERLTRLLDDEGGVFYQQISTHEVDAYIQTMKVPTALDYKDAVKLAMDKEKAAQMLYSVIAGTVEDSAVEVLFLELAGQEKNHYEFFEKENKKIQLHEN